MNGKEILVDTNIILYLLDGSEPLTNFLQGKKVYLSFISELELLGYKDVKPEEELNIAELLSECSILPLTDQIKQKYIELRRARKIKLADAIVAATSIVTEIPLITADGDFKGINKLTLITYNHSINLT